MSYEPPKNTEVEIDLEEYEPPEFNEANLILSLDTQLQDGIISGVALDLNSNPVQGAIVKAVNQETEEVRKTQTDSEGEFSIEVPDGGIFHVSIRHEDSGEFFSDQSIPYLEVEPSNA